MRRINTVVTVLMMVLFLIHAVFGGFQLIGAGSQAFKVLAWICVGLMVIHAAIGVKLSVDSIRIGRRTGAPYFRENQLFWARRVSGLAIGILITFHMTAFSESAGDVYRLRLFDMGKLITQILLVITIAVHVITNVKPMLVSLGIPGLRQFAGDILFILSVILLFFILAFIIYYLRWNSV